MPSTSRGKNLSISILMPRLTQRCKHETLLNRYILKSTPVGNNHITNPKLDRARNQRQPPRFSIAHQWLASEIQPGVVGVKASDLCAALVDRCGGVGSVSVTNIFV